MFEFPITMLGGRGVGKTSMLTAMCHEFDKVIPDAALQLTADSDAEILISQKLAQLMNVAADREGVFDPGEFGIQGTRESTSYRFNLSHAPSRASVQIVFNDYPGGFLVDAHRRRQVIELLKQSFVILVALDAPALMTLAEGDHEIVNQPRNLRSALADTLRESGEQERLVIFVPTRGERWLLNGGGAELFERFQARFESALKVLSQYKSKTAVAYCPVQTLGAVQFARYEGRRVLFEKIRNQPYTPVDCDQVLRYALNLFMAVLLGKSQAYQDELKKHLIDRTLTRKIFDCLRGLVGMPNLKFAELETWQRRSQALMGAINSFAGGCKRDFPFQLIQGAGVLRFPEGKPA